MSSCIHPSWLIIYAFKSHTKDLLDSKIKCFKKIGDTLLQWLPIPLNCSLEVDLKIEHLIGFKGRLFTLMRFPLMSEADGCVSTGR